MGAFSLIVVINLLNRFEMLNDSQVSIEELSSFDRYKYREWRNVVRSSVFYLLVAVTLGVPIWWNTTTIYRAALPEEQVQFNMQRLVQMKVPMYVKFGDNLEEDWKNQLTNMLEMELALVALSYGDMPMDGEESKMVKFNYEITRADLTPVEESEKKPGHINVLIQLKEESEQFLVLPHETVRMTVSPDQNLAVFHVLNDSVNMDTLSNQMCYEIRKKLIQEPLLRYEYSSTIEPRHSVLPQSNVPYKQQKLVSPKREYDIVFTLVNPNPEVYKRERVKWKIEQSISKFLLPFLTALEEWLSSIWLPRLFIKYDLVGIHMRKRPKMPKFII